LLWQGEDVSLQVEPMRALLDNSQVAELRERLARTRWSSVAADVKDG
jgi:hypothetical protein